MTSDRETQKKRGPRTHQARMEHQLQVTSELVISCPPLASLIEALARRELDEREFEDRLKELEGALNSGTYLRSAIADDDDRVTAAQRYADATTRLRILERSGVAIMNARKIARAEASDQWSALKKGLLNTPDPISREILEFAQDLVAAGVTTKGLERKKLRERLRAAVPEPQQSRLMKTPVSVPEPMPFDKVRQLWTDLPNPIPGYNYVERDLNDASGKAGSIGFYLPPFRSLDEISPGLSLSLRLMESNDKRYKMADKVITSWITENKYRPDTSTGRAQVKAWCFVLGFVHHSLDGVEAFNAVKFASPWTGKGIDAQRSTWIGR